MPLLQLGSKTLPLDAVRFIINFLSVSKKHSWTAANPSFNLKVELLHHSVSKKLTSTNSPIPHGKSREFLLCLLTVAA